jgi:hypothetical protein
MDRPWPAIRKGSLAHYVRYLSEEDSPLGSPCTSEREELQYEDLLNGFGIREL